MMKCNKDFIISYNKLFKYLHEQGGRQEVVEFWAQLGPAITAELRELVEKKGVSGMIEYWSGTLGAEEAKCTIIAELSPGEEELTIDMYECPSLRKLAEAGETPYGHYCDHCKMLYGTLLKNLGYKFDLETKPGGCQIWISKES